MQQLQAGQGWLPPTRLPNLGLAQELHRLQMLQVPLVGPEDLTPGDLPQLQWGPGLGENGEEGGGELMQIPPSQ